MNPTSSNHAPEPLAKVHEYADRRSDHATDGNQGANRNRPRSAPLAMLAHDQQGKEQIDA